MICWAIIGAIFNTKMNYNRYIVDKIKKWYYFYQQNELMMK